MAVVLALSTGCTRNCFLAKEDFDKAASHYMPANLESDPQVANQPVGGLISAPADVNHSDREPWNLSLEQALAIALENGTVSDRTGQGGTGIANDQFFTFTGGSLTQQSDRIRVLAMNPAIAAAGIEQSLSRYDAQFITTMNWASTDELQQGLSSFTNGTNANFNSSIVKPLSTGGVVNTSFVTEYRNLVRPPTQTFGVINPQYTTRLILGLEQPLWRDYGTEINQLLNRFPSVFGSTLPGLAAGVFNNRQVALGQGAQLAGANFVTDGILIARIRFDSQRAEFERNVNNLVLNTEIAYWKLYQAYGNLYAFEEVMRIAHKVWMNYDAKYKAGQKGLADFAPIRAQYEEFRGERLKALGAVLEAERNLRRIMGVPVEDGKRIIPVKAPTLAPFQPSWDAALQDALNLRPELVLSRENLRIAQLNLITQKNFLKPDLRFTAQYMPVGFGTTLDGNDNFIDSTGTPRPNNALRSLAGDHFNNWNLGLVFNMPLGFRLEHSIIRQSKLSLAQSYEALKDQEDRVKSVLAQQYQKLSEWYRRIEATTAERRAYGDAVNVRFRELEVGKTTVADFLLDVQRRFALALTKEYEAITEYNNTLARFEWAKGSLLAFNNITISEGALPECVQVRAVENEHRRTHAILLKETPAPITHPARMVGNAHGNGTPQTLENAAAKGSAAKMTADRMTAGRATPAKVTAAAPTPLQDDFSEKTAQPVNEIRTRVNSPFPKDATPSRTPLIDDLPAKQTITPASTSQDDIKNWLPPMTEGRKVDRMEEVVPTSAPAMPSESPQSEKKSEPAAMPIPTADAMPTPLASPPPAAPAPPVDPAPAAVPTPPTEPVPSANSPPPADSTPSAPSATPTPSAEPMATPAPSTEPTATPRSGSADPLPSPPAPTESPSSELPMIPLPAGLPSPPAPGE